MNNVKKHSDLVNPIDAGHTWFFMPGKSNENDLDTSSCV